MEEDGFCRLDRNILGILTTYSAIEQLAVKIKPAGIGWRTGNRQLGQLVETGATPTTGVTMGTASEGAGLGTAAAGSASLGSERTAVETDGSGGNSMRAGRIRSRPDGHGEQAGAASDARQTWSSVRVSGRSAASYISMQCARQADTENNPIQPYVPALLGQVHFPILDRYRRRRTGNVPLPK